MSLLLKTSQMSWDNYLFPSKTGSVYMLLKTASMYMLLPFFSNTARDANEKHVYSCLLNYFSVRHFHPDVGH